MSCHAVLCCAMLCYVQLFGFKKPIAHAMYLVARLEAQLSTAGGSSLLGACWLLGHITLSHFLTFSLT